MVAAVVAAEVSCLVCKMCDLSTARVTDDGEIRADSRNRKL